MSEARLRYLLRPREVSNCTGLPVLSVYRDHGVVPKGSRTDNFNKTPEDISRYQEVRVGDLVVNKMKAWQGSVGVSAHHGVVSPDYLVCAVNPAVESRYLHYLLRSAPLRAEFGARSKGIRPAQWRLYWEDLAEVRVTIPSLRKQCLIASYLDAEIAQIERLARLRTDQIELIDLRASSFLSATADDLGAQFGRVRVRHVLQKIEQGWSPQCEDRQARGDEWGVVKAGCINGGTFDATQHKVLPPGVEPQLRYRLQAADLLISRASGSLELIGSAGVVPDGPMPRLLLCDKIYRLRMDRTRMRPEFVALMLGTHEVRQQIMLGTSGADGMANNLPTATVVNLLLPNVPLKMQASVIEDLYRRRDFAHQAKRLLTDQLDVLGRRRQALITAAVCGQIDVTTASGVAV